MKNLFIYTFTLLIVSLSASCGSETKSKLAPNEDQEKNAYESWKKQAIANKEYVTKEDCGTAATAYSIPEDFDKKTGDLNGDGHQDALFIITPISCESGNKVKFQNAILLLSNIENQGYEILRLGNPLSGENKENTFYTPHDFSEEGKMKATRFEYQEGDESYCPSLQKEIELTYKEGRFFHAEVAIQ